MSWRPVLAGVALVVLVACSEKASGKAGAISVWLPYEAGRWAVCLQEAQSEQSHREIYAWDFALWGDARIVAALAGRVFWVIDDRSQHGRNDFHEANQIFIDHGDGHYSTYLHHKKGSSRVQVGQYVGVGTYLADVGNTGTISEHIHFALRGPAWQQTHNLNFIDSKQRKRKIEAWRLYRSGTQVQHQTTGRDSLLQGKEFESNAIILESRQRAFWIPSEQELVYIGRVLGEASTVAFQLWPSAHLNEYSTKAAPDEQGHFILRVRVPRAWRGPHWYRITAIGSDGKSMKRAALPAMVH